MKKYFTRVGSKIKYDSLYSVCGVNIVELPKNEKKHLKTLMNIVKKH